MKPFYPYILPATEPAAAVVAKVTTNGEVGGDEEPSRVVSATSDDVYEPVNVGAQVRQTTSFLINPTSV